VRWKLTPMQREVKKKLEVHEISEGQKMTNVLGGYFLV
jgi:hypothetical protein